MLRADEISELLQQRPCVVLDGGLATEIEARGYDIAHPLWSGKVLIDDPLAIKQVHLDYILAGADIIITASYQASVRGLQQHYDLSEQAAREIIKSSVEIAKQARAEAYQSGIPTTRRLLIAGSVGPYGAYLADGSEYTGAYEISQDALKAFHRPRLQALVDAGVDLLAIETVPSFNEIQAIVDLLQEEFPTAIAWISCTLKDSTHIADGTSISRVIEVLEAARPHIVAFGANCVPPSLITEFLSHSRGLTSIPLLCYPNSGEQYDAESKAWQAGSSEKTQLREDVVRWCQAGARVIGGCCRTTLADITLIYEACRDQV